MTSLLTPGHTTIKASSTLDKSSHRKHVIDRNPDTCWASANGSPQWLSFTLPQPAILKTVSLTFQGGFVATEVIISTSTSTSPSSGAGGWKTVATIYPQDNNFRQTFPITGEGKGGRDGEGEGEEEGQGEGEGEGEGMRVEGAVKLEFPKSSDFFGRVVLYDLDLVGDWVQEEDREANGKVEGS